MLTKIIIIIGLLCVAALFSLVGDVIMLSSDTKVIQYRLDVIDKKLNIIELNQTKIIQAITKLS